MFLYTTDLHLQEGSGNEYKFKLFPWLRKKAKRHNVEAIFILGDLTDKKDKHSSKLVNRIVDELGKLGKIAPVYILRGNHDCLDPNEPFFQFLSRISNVFFITHLTQVGDDLENICPKGFRPPSDHNYIFVPHDRGGNLDWRSLELGKADFVLLHQTVGGAIAENGWRLDGLSTQLFKRVKGRVFSGDVHVPQKVGNVIYVGSPYHIHFGDGFKPRVLLVPSPMGKVKELYFPAPRKHVVTVRKPKELLSLDNIKKGDSIRVRLKMSRSSFVDWPNMKREVTEICKELGVSLFGVEVFELKRLRLPNKDADTGEVIPNVLGEDPMQSFVRFCRINKEGIGKERLLAGSALLVEEGFCKSNVS